MCKNSIKYRTDVAISAKYMKDVGCSALKICGFEIEAIIIVVLLKKHKAGFYHYMSHVLYNTHVHVHVHIYTRVHVHIDILSAVMC